MPSTVKLDDLFMMMEDDVRTGDKGLTSAVESFLWQGKNLGFNHDFSKEPPNMLETMMKSALHAYLNRMIQKSYEAIKVGLNPADSMFYTLDRELARLHDLMRTSTSPEIGSDIIDRIHGMHTLLSRLVKKFVGDAK